MRTFIRHPTSVPVTYSTGDRVAETEEELKNISHGGLCFVSRRAVKPGTSINVRIPVGEQPFEAKGVVVWCNRVGADYEIGVSFLETRTEFCVRMVEQICRIELYRAQVRENEGRVLSGKEAALEWIEKNAEQFPQ